MKTMVSKRRTISRRSFLATTGASVTAFAVLPRYILGGARFVPPSELINIAIVGCGGQGRTNVRALFHEPDARIIAVADPIEHHDLERFYYRGVAGRKPVKAEIENHYSSKQPGYKCAEYEDYRVMYEKEKAIDAILCATPDHLHACVCVPAMRLGKHVYCEKPLAHCVAEVRLMAKVARETGVATQMGNQGHSGEGIRATVEWIRAGAIGPVREVHAWTGAGLWGNQLRGRPPEAPVPAGVNWDLWLGPREPRPYSPAYTPVTWRDFWAFGTAPIGDMACHNLDPAFWALDLAEPATIEATAAGGVDSEVVPVGSFYTYRYPARGDMPPVTVHWYDGGLRPPRPQDLDPDVQFGGGANGILFIGDKGKIMCPGWGGDPTLVPLTLMDSYQRPPKTIPRVKGHHRDWLDACKGGKPASANFEYGAKLTEVVLLGTVALRVGKPIQWDPVEMKATNAPEAERFLRDTYRPGWEPK